ncbi:DinB family protein [Paenibacillus filicis]|uniref:DinB family protein n=1 Tax=Paenibacillus gyeongsangnamensis TaxID=3388067 RepID=A0ABT4Q4J9_9BACL|nr:DinB family protein [Paenibacillus filicis]MCZ8511787.1 DinB family protein [Paenibacillus filicis]
MPHPALEMFDYHVWANQTILKRLQELPKELYEQEIVSVFPSISKVMPHIYMTDSCWLDILSGISMKEAIAIANSLKEPIGSKSIEELGTMFIELAQRYKSFFSQHENLDQTMVLDNPYAGIRETKYSEIVLQIVNHGTYHRGNITAMMRQLGHASVMTEYALFWYST